MASTNEAQRYSASPSDTNRGAHSTVHGSPTAPATKSTAEAVTRTIQHAESWQPPQFNRRQSWNREESKHEAHMGHIDGVCTGPGFSER
jgi:hypothetical protein